MENTIKNPGEDYWTPEDIDKALEPATFPEANLDEDRPYLTPWQMIARRFLRNKLAIMGLIALAVMFIFCYIFPFFYPYNETEIFYADKVTGQELRIFEISNAGDALLNRLQPPSAAHWLGTNEMGQDMLARLMFGGRISLMVGFVVILVELVIGIALGGIAGYYGGIIDGIIMRVVDIISCLPFIPLMLIISAVLLLFNISPRDKIFYTMFLLGGLQWVGVCRMIRGNVLSLRESEFMQAATATGIRTRSKIFRHLVPNTLTNIVVRATLDLGIVILLESTLSFLGVGVGAPWASWGNMVSSVNDRLIMKDYLNIWVAPGLCILITVMAFNFVGDGLRDATDPKMKR